MNFSYETQGALTYLVCEIEPTEQVDSLILGMLTNNHILGLAPVIYTEMNGQRYLKYNISAKVTAGQFFAGTVSKDIALKAISNILSAICSADEYMIDLNCFSVLPEHVYLNVSNCETALVCVPVVTDKNIGDELKLFLNKILSAQTAGGQSDSSYAQQILDYIESENITAYSLYDYIKNFKPVQVAASAPVLNQVQPQITQSEPVAPAVSTAPAISPFENTISIDDMPQMGASSIKPTISENPVATPVNTPPSNNFTPPVQQSPVNQPQTIGVNSPVIQQAPPIQVPPVQVPPMQVPPVQVPPVQVPPMQKPGQANGFAPASMGQKQAPAGQPKMDVPPVATRKEGGMAIPPAMPIPEPAKKPKKEKAKKPKKEKAASEGNNTDKKIGIFDLLAHYNKENVALYKAQKEAEKLEKNAAKADQQQSGQANNNAPAQIPPFPNNAANPYANASPYGMGGAVPVMQPVPVQNSFNETTVLSAFGGETTVLSAEPQITGPYLIRIKTGEKISLNKPVFRIGKEKSYVDYFIADNTAISRSHANIHTENGEYFVEDTNSTNHTYVNGSIISSNIKMKITSGDKIKLANEEFTFVV